MYGFTKKKNRYTNRLIAVTAIFIIVKIIVNIAWDEVFNLYAKYSFNYELYLIISGTATLVLNLILIALSVLAISFVMKIRESEDTKRIYKLLIWFTMADGVLNIANLNIFVWIFYGNSLYITIYNVYYYIALVIPAILYALILKKEKLNLNWFVIGSLTDIYLIAENKIIISIRSYLDDGLKKMTEMLFNQKYPVLAVYADNDILGAIRGNLWIVGLIVFIIILKINYKKASAAGNISELESE